MLRLGGFFNGQSWKRRHLALLPDRMEWRKDIGVGCTPLTPLTHPPQRPPSSTTALSLITEVVVGQVRGVACLSLSSAGGVVHFKAESPTILQVWADALKDAGRGT